MRKNKSHMKCVRRVTRKILQLLLFVSFCERVGKVIFLTAMEATASKQNVTCDGWRWQSFIEYLARWIQYRSHFLLLLYLKITKHTSLARSINWRVLKIQRKHSSCVTFWFVHFFIHSHQIHDIGIQYIGMTMIGNRSNDVSIYLLSNLC